MWSTLVAILGTTISPYLFFWQAAQEVEEERAQGRHTVQERQGASTSEIRMRTFDVLAGTFASNLVMFFIILTTAITLHAHGIIAITTSREAMVALEPIAGRFASGLYALAIVGVDSPSSLALGSARRAGGVVSLAARADLLHQAPGFYGWWCSHRWEDRWTLINRSARCMEPQINGVLRAVPARRGAAGGERRRVMAQQPSSVLTRNGAGDNFRMTAAAVGMSQR
jgi:hypothetical protein